MFENLVLERLNGKKDSSHTITRQLGILDFTYAYKEDVLEKDVLEEDLLEEDVLEEDVLEEDVLEEDVLEEDVLEEDG